MRIQSDIQVHAFIIDERADEDYRIGFLVTIWRKEKNGNPYIHNMFPDRMALEDLLEVMDTPVKVVETPTPEE